MRVDGIKGQDLAALFATEKARIPAPDRRNADGVPKEPHSIKAVDPPVVEQVQEAASKIEAPPPSDRGGVRLRVDKDARRVVAQILDRQREVLRQIPPQEVLDAAARFRRLQGLLFDEQV